MVVFASTIPYRRAKDRTGQNMIQYDMLRYHTIPCDAMYYDTLRYESNRLFCLGQYLCCAQTNNAEKIDLDDLFVEKNTQFILNFPAVSL